MALSRFGLYHSSVRRCTAQQRLQLPFFVPLSRTDFIPRHAILRIYFRDSKVSGEYAEVITKQEYGSTTFIYKDSNPVEHARLLEYCRRNSGHF